MAPDQSTTNHILCRDDGAGAQMRATAQQMYAIEAVLRHTLKFRQEPFEWVYQGYAPLLLPSVVSSRCATTSQCVHDVAALKR